jgi:hypothetical protein
MVPLSKCYSSILIFVAGCFLASKLIQASLGLVPLFNTDFFRRFFPSF